MHRARSGRFPDLWSFCCSLPKESGFITFPESLYVEYCQSGKLTWWIITQSPAPFPLTGGWAYIMCLKPHFSSHIVGLVWPAPILRHLLTINCLGPSWINSTTTMTMTTPALPALGVLPCGFLSWEILRIQRPLPRNWDKSQTNSLFQGIRGYHSANRTVANQMLYCASTGN